MLFFHFGPAHTFELTKLNGNVETLCYNAHTTWGVQTRGPVENKKQPAEKTSINPHAQSQNERPTHVASGQRW